MIDINTPIKVCLKEREIYGYIFDIARVIIDDKSNNDDIRIIMLSMYYKYGDSFRKIIKDIYERFICHYEISHKKKCDYIVNVIID